MKKIILLITIIYFILRYIINNETGNFDNIDFNHMINVANTGDLICFRWSELNTIYRLFSMYSHVGMIIKINSKLYILETHPKNKISNNKSGVHLYLLESRIKKNFGSFYYSKLNTTIKKRKQIELHIKTNLKMYKKSIKFDNNFQYVFVKNYIYNLLNLNLKLDKKTMFCSEFIGSILKITNIYNHKNITGLHPGSFTYLMGNDKRKLYNQLLKIDLVK